MTEPLAIVLFEKVLPGTQLVERLQELRYRVEVVQEPALLLPQAEQSRPMLVLADLHAPQNAAVDAIRLLRHNAATAHVPVIAFCARQDCPQADEARQAGATLVVTEAAILGHLPQLLDQALTQF